MKATVLLSLAFAFILGSSANADAQPGVDAQVRNSYLALSAFECSFVATDSKERERLFSLGLKTGREFLDFALRNPDVDRTALQPKIAILWHFIGAGPSTDFILGRIFEDRKREVYKDFSPDEQLWKLKLQNMYREKNCALLGTK